MYGKSGAMQSSPPEIDGPSMPGHRARSGDGGGNGSFACTCFPISTGMFSSLCADVFPIVSTSFTARRNRKTSPQKQENLYGKNKNMLRPSPEGR